MDMSRVAEQEGASFPEMLRHAVVDVIGRKPVYFFDLDLKTLNDPTTDILKFECISVIGTFVPYRPVAPPNRAAASDPQAIFCRRCHKPRRLIGAALRWSYGGG
jgi:hypothetical protein